ncbi:MAG TPA: metallophosphoesterase [Novosphingobium sp.]|nr:metallophosphoesterase [Novosphingobium sp.]
MKVNAFVAMAGLMLQAPAAHARLLDSFVVMAPEGAEARAVVDDATCPALTLDGAQVPMSARAAPATLPARASDSGSAASHPSAFPHLLCSAHLPRSAHTASLAGQALPLAPAVVRRIVVVGDTGCRLKAGKIGKDGTRSEDAWQDCNRASAWPFAQVARSAAALHPDLVLHVGDYLYRESACPAHGADCADTPWGYGEDAWRADFLTPARTLLAAAPWVLVRGNHEDCMRAGQGWWRLLDPHALVPGTDCVREAEDFAGNHADPYAVELGDGARIIVADFAAIGEKHLQGPELLRYRTDALAIAGLAKPGDVNFVTSHYPFSAVTISGKKGLKIGYPSVDDAFGGQHPPALPHVTAMIAGHVHLLQVVQPRNAPFQLVNGFSGTQEQEPKAPLNLADLEALAAGEQAGIAMTDIATRFGQFGFSTLDRQADGSWLLIARDVNGKKLLRRIIQPRP